MSDEGQPSQRLRYRETIDYAFPKDTSFRWAQLVTFQVDCYVDTEQIVAAYMQHDRYRDRFWDGASPTQDQVHGPYRIDALQVADYRRMATAKEAAALLEAWARRWDDSEWEGPHAQDLQAKQVAARPEVSAWCIETSRLFRRGDVLHLPALNASKEDEIGWILDDFEEWLIIDHHAH